MENDMADCPKCTGILRKKGDSMVCNNPFCGFRRGIEKPEPSKDELLKENERLKETIAELVKELSHNAQD